MRLPAASFEGAVADAIANHLQDQVNRHAILKHVDVTRSHDGLKAVTALAKKLRTGGSKAAAPLIRGVKIEQKKLKVQLNPEAVATAIGLSETHLGEALRKISTAFARKRRSVETRMIAGEQNPEPDHTLIRGLRNAQAWSDAFKSGERLKDVAQRVGHSERYIRRVVSLISLAPRLQAAILDGTRPAHLNLEILVRGHIPVDWSHQDDLVQLES